MTDISPTLITRSMIMGALKDDAFYKCMPEFSTLKPKLSTMGVKLGGGCSGCRERKVAQNIMADFLSVLGVLSADSVARLKGYFGIQKLMYSLHNPKSGAYVTKIV